MMEYAIYGGRGKYHLPDSPIFSSAKDAQDYLFRMNLDSNKNIVILYWEGENDRRTVFYKAVPRM